MEDNLTIKILKSGDKVLNVWHGDNKIHIAIKSKNEEVLVHCVEQDENGQPKLSTAPKITIMRGDGEVWAMKTDENGQQILSVRA
jgi:hypothetical protein